MRKIRDIIRLHFDCGISTNQIAKSIDVARSVVQECLRRVKAKGLIWPLPEELDDFQLERLLYNAPKTPNSLELPDWSHIDQELRKKGVTRELLWLEYKETKQTKGTAIISYPQFCRLYKQWRKKLNVVMRQDHRAGEKLFVDYAGPTIPVVDAETGEVKAAQLFVAVLGASNYTYAEAAWSQNIDSWNAAHIRTFQFLGGVPELLVPDNLKSGVTKSDRFEPQLNERYHQMARHYRVAIFPARSFKPKDKAKVEKGVQFAETWIIAVLRNTTFFTLSELNTSIAQLLQKLNNKPFKKLTGTRTSWFESVDRPALKPLPQTTFEDAGWLKIRVGNDYHININQHYYSVPHSLVGQEVEARITANTVEVLHGGKRITSHKVNHNKNKNTTKREHRPPSHQYMDDWTPERITNWAQKIGPATLHLVQSIMKNADHPQVGLRACLGLLSLHKEFTAQRLEAACVRAANFPHSSISSIRSLLKHNLDKQTIQLPIPNLTIPHHENIRGAQYFSTIKENQNAITTNHQ
jgi:transposase